MILMPVMIMSVKLIFIIIASIVHFSVWTAVMLFFVCA